MGVKKVKIVIIGAGMSGLVAAHKLYTAQNSARLFDLVVVEAGDRIGGRIHTSELAGDRVEMGATWIHGIGGSPLYEIADKIGALHSSRPWERMDGFPDCHITVAEGGGTGGGRLVEPSLVDPISSLYLNLMDFAKGASNADENDCRFYETATHAAGGGDDEDSVGAFLRRGLRAYWDAWGDSDSDSDLNITRRSLEESIFAMHENSERTYTSASDLFRLDFRAESEYELFPGEEITIAKGYSRVIESLASVLPPNMIRLKKKVEKIEWLRDDESGPVKLHFADGTAIFSDHVIVTVSLGVLKAGIKEDSRSFFSPELPYFKRDAISRLGFGTVNKLFLHLEGDAKIENTEFPFLQMAFHQNLRSLNHGKIPWWMRKTASLCPIYKKSRVLLSWFAGEEAMELESLKEEEIKKGVSATLAAFRPHSAQRGGRFDWSEVKIGKVLKSGWGSDPLFMGSYSFIAVGSSGEDLDSLAAPLPAFSVEAEVRPLQILFAGEATDRRHYSTTHGAYLSGLREANRLLQYYSHGG